MLDIRGFRNNLAEQDDVPAIGIVMGSWSDWGVMESACDVLDELDVSYETGVISAHRTPAFIAEYAERAEAYGFSAVIAGAGGAAHLPGMLAACMPVVPVIGVPVKTSTLSGVDSLHSIVQMPAGIPVATMAINGAQNAGILAAQFHALRQTDQVLRDQLIAHRESLAEMVKDNPDPSHDPR